MKLLTMLMRISSCSDGAVILFNIFWEFQKRKVLKSENKMIIEVVDEATKDAKEDVNTAGLK